MDKPNKRAGRPRRVPNAAGQWQCKKCGQYKNVEDFAKGTDGKPHSYCRACFNGYNMDRLKQKKAQTRCPMCAGEGKIQDARRVTLAIHACEGKREGRPVTVLRGIYRGATFEVTHDGHSVPYSRLLREFMFKLAQI